MRSLHDRVIVTDPEGIRGALLALPIVRSLGRRSIGTTLMTQESLVPSMFSRWRSERIYCPSSINNLESFETILQKIARTRRYRTIFPLSDTALRAISERREQLAPYLSFALPSHESILKTLDKSQTLKIAEEIGIPIPKTFFVRSTPEIVDISARIRYPAVIKPRWSYFRGQNGKANLFRPLYVNSASELISTYAKVAERSPSPMIQEYVPGHNISVGLLFDHNQLKAVCAIKSKREIPVTGGISVLRESIPPDPTILRYAISLLRSLDWHGVAEVDFKVDSRDSTPKLMEINPRFWGSMNVAIESGVDFPYLSYLLAKGEQIRPVLSYKVGVKFRWLNGDFENLCAVLKGEPKSMISESSNKLNAVLDFLKFYEKNIHYDGLTLFDPFPLFVEEALFTYGAIGKPVIRRILPTKV